MSFLNLTFKTVLCFLLLISLAGCIHPHHGRRAVTVHKVAPVGKVWVAGHWVIRKRNRVWVPGHWR